MAGCISIQGRGQGWLPCTAVSLHRSRPRLYLRLASALSGGVPCLSSLPSVPLYLIHRMPGTLAAAAWLRRVPGLLSDQPQIFHRPATDFPKTSHTPAKDQPKPQLHNSYREAEQGKEQLQKGHFTEQADRRFRAINHLVLQLRLIN